jgi:hypothetical protein
MIWEPQYIKAVAERELNLVCSIVSELVGSVPMNDDVVTVWVLANNGGFASESSPDTSPQGF